MLVYLLKTIDPTVIQIPADSEVLYVREHLGQIRLYMSIGKSEELTRLVFFVYDDGQYMDNPNLGYIDSVGVGDSIFHCFLDDLWNFTPFVSKPLPVAGTKSLLLKTPSGSLYLAVKKVRVVNLEELPLSSPIPHNF